MKITSIPPLIGDDHHQVSAHKLILSACSEYFKNIFKYNSMPNVHPLLCLDGVSADDLNNVMEYIYNGEVKLYQTNLKRFLDVAQRLKLEGMTDMENEEDYFLILSWIWTTVPSVRTTTYSNDNVQGVTID